MSVVGASEDRRLELAASAARARRSNEPRSLLLFAGLVLTVALLVATLAWRSYAGAAEALDLERQASVNALAKAAELKAMLAAGAATNSQAWEPSTTIASRISGAGVEAGLKSAVGLPKGERTRGENKLGSKQVQYDYELRDPSFEALLKFMQAATQRVPGLEVHSVLIRPEAQEWFLRVTFARWERMEGNT